MRVGEDGGQGREETPSLVPAQRPVDAAPNALERRAELAPLDRAVNVRMTFGENLLDMVQVPAQLAGR